MSTKRTINVLPSTYQPSQAEIKEEFKINATPRQLAKALLKPVEVRTRSVAEYHSKQKG